MNKEEYVERVRFIWRTFVPLNGQAEFEQGELIRSVEKLRDEAQRNANANFNDKCHKILVAFLREKLTDKSVFDENIINQINFDIDLIGTKDHPYLDNDIYDRLSERVVDWCAIYQEPIPHKKNPELNC
jgi:hypothetical protein